MLARTPMVEMKGLLQDVLRRQKETHVRLDQLDKRGAATVPELPADIEFPLSTVADVDSLEAKLADLRLQECVVSVSLNSYPVPIINICKINRFLLWRLNPIYPCYMNVCYGAIQVLRKVFFWKLDTLSNTFCSISPITFISKTAFSAVLM